MVLLVVQVAVLERQVLALVLVELEQPIKVMLVAQPPQVQEVKAVEVVVLER